MQNLAALTGEYLTNTQKEQLEAQKKLAKHCRIVEEEFGIDCRAMVRAEIGKFEYGLKNEFRNGAYDLVIMGTNGAEDLQQYYFGSHTYKTLKDVNIPLLVVPEDCGFKEMEKVVYALDYDNWTDHEENNIQVIKDLLGFLQPIQPELTLLRVSREDDEVSEAVFTDFRNLVKKELDHEGGIEFQRVIDEDTAHGIDTYLVESESHLLILLAKEYDFLEKLFRSSITKKLSFIASYPMLVYHR